MVGHALHAVHKAISIEQRAAALALQSGRTHFHAKNFSFSITKMSCHHAFNGKANHTYCIVCPAYYFGCLIVFKIGKLWKRKTKPAKENTRLQFAAFFCKYCMACIKFFSEVFHF